MKIEILLFVYAAVCLSMIAFNLLYAIGSHWQKMFFHNRCFCLQKKLSSELERIHKAQPISPSHLRYLKSKLKKPYMLLCFERLMSEYAKADISGIRLYLQQIESIIPSLAAFYANQKESLCAYFTHFICSCFASPSFCNDDLQNILFGYILKNNLYCKVNSLHTLMQFGNISYIMDALRILDDDTTYLHPQIITKSLLSFQGNDFELISKLLNNWNDFSVCTQLGVWNYLCFKSNDYFAWPDQISIPLQHNDCSQKSSSSFSQFQRITPAEVMLI